MIAMTNVSGGSDRFDESESSTRWRKVTIGSNVAIGEFGGILVVDGEEQVKIERGAEDHQLLLAMELFDRTGARIAKLRRNAWSFAQDRYQLSTNPRSLRLVLDDDPGSVVFEAAIIGQDELEISRAVLHRRRAKGKLRPPIVITPDAIEVNTNRFSRNTVQGMGMLRIDDGGIAFGFTG